MEIQLRTSNKIQDVLQSDRPRNESLDYCFTVVADIMPFKNIITENYFGLKKKCGNVCSFKFMAQNGNHILTTFGLNGGGMRLASRSSQMMSLKKSWRFTSSNPL
jgi:hypothetical protein